MLNGYWNVWRIARLFIVVFIEKILNHVLDVWLVLVITIFNVISQVLLILQYEISHNLS